jgi:hypothetical protein
MPASSLGALNSWGVYLIASVALVGALTPQLMGVVGDSKEGADWRNADGIHVALDALRPGIVLTLSYGTWSTDDIVHLGGRDVSITYGNGMITFPTVWNLPNVTLTPSMSYCVWLAGTDVQVTQAG